MNEAQKVALERALVMVNGNTTVLKKVLAAFATSTSADAPSAYREMIKAMLHDATTCNGAAVGWITAALTDIPDSTPTTS